MSDVLDLDALMPPDVTIKFGGLEIAVKPPKVVDVLKLGFLGQKMQKAEELNDAELEKTVGELTAHVVKCIPELAGKELNTSQLLAVVQIISEMSVPPDSKELKKRGISTDSPKVQ